MYGAKDWFGWVWQNGCCEISGHVGTTTLTFVTFVMKVTS
jgi:hypothetical protein